MKLGVVMDPIESINFKKDSTLSMMLEAQKRGHKLFYMKPESLFIDSGISYAETSCVHVKNDPQDWYSLEKERIIKLSELNVILMRQDLHLILHIFTILMFWRCQLGKECMF